MYSLVQSISQTPKTIALDEQFVGIQLWRVISAKIKTNIFGRNFFGKGELHDSNIFKGELHPSNIILHHSNV